MITRNKHITVLFVFFIAFLSSVMLMKGIDITFEISQHSIASLLIKAVFFVLLIIAFILRRRETLIFLFIVSFPFMRIMFVGITLLTAYAMILLFIYRKEVFEFYISKKNIFRPYFLMLLFVLFVSTLLSRYPSSALPNIIFFLSLCGVYLVLTAFMDSEYKQNAVTRTLILIFFFCILVSFFQYFFGINSVRFFFGEYNKNVSVYGFVKRIPSVFWEAQGAGQYFAIMVILLLGLKERNFKNFKWLLWVLSLLGIAALFMTKSRMAIFAFIFSYFIILIFTRSFRKPFVLILLVSILFLFSGLFFRSLPLTMRERFNQDEITRSLDYRTKLWKESLPIALHNPLGVGLGDDNVYEAAMKQNVFFLAYFNDFRLRQRGIQFENSYLQILYSLGIIGFLSFLLLVTRYFSLGVALLKKCKLKCEKKYVMHLLGSMIVWLLCSFTSPQILESQSMIIFIALLALMNSSWCIYKEKT